MLGAGTLFILLTVLFVAYTSLVSTEERKGKRLFLVGVRGWLDKWLDIVIEAIFFRLKYLGRHIIKLSWYYSLHSALRTVLMMIVKVYEGLENIFNRNRERAKVLRAERKAIKSKNNLSKVVEYKAINALTSAEKKQLRAKKLERD
jgi:hypothetical protein